MDHTWETIEKAVADLHQLNGKVIDLNQQLRVTALDFRDLHQHLDRLYRALPKQSQNHEQSYLRAYVDQYLQASARLINEFEATGMYDAVPLSYLIRQDTTA